MWGGTAVIGIVGINKGIRSWNELSLEVTSGGRGLGSFFG